jgi:hypothetical protein
MLVLGILMFGIFVYDYTLRKDGKGGIFERDTFKTWSCKPIQVKLERKGLPSGWEMDCSKILLKFEIELSENVSEDLVKSYMYKELANSLVWIARNSPGDTLEKVQFVQVEVNTDTLKIVALTPGEHLQVFKQLKDEKQIKRHLQSTVKVKETIK